MNELFILLFFNLFLNILSNNLNINENNLKYFKGLNKIYSNNLPNCLIKHKENGWKTQTTTTTTTKNNNNLPLYVIAIGTEASG